MQTSNRVRATPWSPWKALEFKFRLQGRLKSPWKKWFCGKQLENSLNICLDESCRDCIMSRENEDHTKLKTSQKLSKLTIWGKINAKIKMPVHALNFQDVGKNINVGFFSKHWNMMKHDVCQRNLLTSTPWKLNFWFLKTPWILLEFHIQNLARTLQYKHEEVTPQALLPNFNFTINVTKCIRNSSPEVKIRNFI